MARSVPPYFLCDPDAVRFGGWSLRRFDDWAPLPESLADWDYNTDLTLRTTIQVDDARLRRSTRLGAGVDLSWSISWRSLDSNLTGTALRSPYQADEVFACEIVLHGQELGSEIELRATLVRRTSGPDRGDGSAHLAGSVLWEDRRRLALAGDAARFPVVVTDFGACGLDPDASLSLEAPADLSSPVLGGLLLLVNERDTRLVRQIVEADRQTDLVDQLQEFVAVKLIDLAVERAQELLEGEWEEGSVAQSLLLLAARTEGGLTELVRLRDQSPNAFQTVLVGTARRMGMGRSLG